VEFERGTGRALRIIFRGVNGVDRIIDEGGASSSVVISGHSWSPDGTRLAYVFSDLQGTAHWTEARVYDFRSRRIVFWKEAAEEIRWAEGSRTLIAIVGNAGTKELETPGRRISVWANDAQVIDVETGSATCLIRDVSFTRGYDVTKAGNLPDPFDALCEAEVRTLLPNTMAWQGMREEHAAWIESNRLEALRITKLLAQTLDLSTRERLWTELRSPDIERVLCSARLLRAAGEERSNVAAAALVGSDRDAILNDYLDQGERLRRSERVPR
jgi:hypothetical protein